MAKRKAVASGRSIAECLADPRGPDSDFEPPRLAGPHMRPVDFDWVYLFDTNVVSALRFLDRQSPTLRAWASAVAFGDCYLSVISRMAIEVGALRRERRDPASAVRLRQWIERELEPTFADRILPVDERVAVTCASVHVPDPSPERDALIRATAIVRDLTMVTRNTRDFARLPLRLADPWGVA